MDLSISCQDIYCIYKHPLSILIHLKFQDKDGCSRNGSREFLFELKMVSDSHDYWKGIKSYSIKVDYRRVLLYINSNLIGVQHENLERILKFRQFDCNNLGSDQPLIDDEKNIAPISMINSVEYGKHIVCTSDMKSVGGHVVFIKMEALCWEDERFESIANLPFLKKATIDFAKIPPPTPVSSDTFLFSSSYSSSSSSSVVLSGRSETITADKFGRLSFLSHLTIFNRNLVDQRPISPILSQFYKFTKLKVLEIHMASDKRDFDFSFLYKSLYCY